MERTGLHTHTHTHMGTRYCYVHYFVTFSSLYIIYVYQNLYNRTAFYPSRVPSIREKNLEKLNLILVTEFFCLVCIHNQGAISIKEKDLDKLWLCVLGPSDCFSLPFPSTQGLHLCSGVSCFPRGLFLAAACLTYLVQGASLFSAVLSSFLGLWYE